MDYPAGFEVRGREAEVCRLHWSLMDWNRHHVRGMKNLTGFSSSMDLQEDWLTHAFNFKKTEKTTSLSWPSGCMMGYCEAVSLNSKTLSTSCPKTLRWLQDPLEFLSEFRYTKQIRKINSSLSKAVHRQSTQKVRHDWL
jgi:hypothetical protein